MRRLRQTHQATEAATQPADFKKRHLKTLSLLRLSTGSDPVNDPGEAVWLEENDPDQQ